MGNGEQPKTGREYLRVSADKSGRERSVEEQHDDNMRAADQRGVTLGQAYRENGAVSASRYGRKARDAYAELVDDLRSGRFGADELWLWENSRGSRKAGEWVALVDELETAGVLVYVTTHARTYDPRIPRDRKALLEAAIDAEYSSAESSLRVRRAQAANAAAGKPHGPASYGFERLFDPRTGRPIGQRPVPGEAAVIRELFRRIDAGEALVRIARDFAERGIRSRAGRPLGGRALRDMAMRHAYAGLRIHHGQTSKATWDPIVPEALFWSVYRRLTAPERITTKPGRASHLLTLDASAVCCHTCESRLRAKFHRHPMYMCVRGCVAVAEADLDGYVEEVLIGYLSREDVYAAFAARQDDAHLEPLRAELGKVRTELQDAERAEPATVFEARQLAALVERLTLRKDELEAEERRLTVPPALAGMVGPKVDVERRWQAASLPVRREVARLLLAPQFLGQLRIAPCGGRGLWASVPAVDRVRWRREAAEA